MDNIEPVTFATVATLAMGIVLRWASNYIKTNGKAETNGIRTLADVVIDQQKAIEKLEEQVEILQDNKEFLKDLSENILQNTEQLIALQKIIGEIRDLASRSSGPQK